VLPNFATALLVGGILAFALSFDEIVHDLHCAGTDASDLDFERLFRPTAAGDERGAILVIVMTFVPL
jgi:ABC-type spermidine/putrescine transport system permease subunit II